MLTYSGQLDSRVSNHCMRIVRRLAVVATALMLLLGALGIYSHQLKRSADGVIRVSYELSKRDRTPTIADLRQQFGSELKQPDPCTPSGCKYEVMLSN